MNESVGMSWIYKSPFELFQPSGDKTAQNGGLLTGGREMAQRRRGAMVPATAQFFEVAT
jgi:hypothetical protein